MKRLFALAGLLAVVVAGCGQPQSQGELLASSSAAGLDCTGPAVESCAVRCAITKLTCCTGGYAGDPPPAGTRRQLVWIEVSTGAAYDPVRHCSGQVTRFQSIDDEEVTTGGDVNPSTWWSCVPERERMGFGGESWMANRKYAGAIEIYLPENAVKIVGGNGMWERSLA